MILIVRQKLSNAAIDVKQSASKMIGAQRLEIMPEEPDLFATVPARPFSPPDMDLASEVFDAMCGHGALAAALGIPVMDVMQYFEAGGYVNIPMMLAAIRKAGKGYGKIAGVTIPKEGNGVALVQWIGPWCKPGVPPAAACAHRHWIAVSDGRVWDSNFELWGSFEEWNGCVPRELYCPKTTGHEIGGIWILK